MACSSGLVGTDGNDCLMATPGRQLGGPGFEIVETALASIRRYRMVEEGETVVVAVSGGPDSTCLLDVLWRLADRLDLTLEIAHVDHGLSDESADIAARVARQGAADGFDVHTVRAPDLAGPNLHARAREFRYGFFEIVANETGATRIATGHTLDDRVETTLARLVHGAGTSSLAGIPPVEGSRIRPLIGVRRAETRNYCEEAGLTFDVDPANDNVRFERAVIRSKVLAAIEDHWGEGAVRAMARSAERLREDATALDGLAERLYSEIANQNADGTSFDRKELTALPRALRHRLLDRAVGRLRDRSGGIEAALNGLDAEEGDEARYYVAEGVEILLQKDRVLVIPPTKTN
jgi:tRNA(Ile)-lysidine synthase